jgi:hypothetical protein
MATTLNPSNDAAQGTYRVTFVTDIERAVHVGCPECGAVVLLHDVHISPEGEVRPNFMHGCGFNDTLQLAGWTTLRPSFPTAQRGSNPTAR